MNGCNNCRYCMCYPSHDYWTPDEYECMGSERNLDIELTDDQWDEIMTRVWTNGESWKDDEEPICPAWEEFIFIPRYYEEPDYIAERRRERMEDGH